MSNKVDTSKKRYAFIPLEKEKQDIALPGEIVVDRKTGDYYVVDENGELRSRTSNIENLIDITIRNNSANIVGDLYNDQRKSYRLFFDDHVARLDRSLTLPIGAYFFLIHDMVDSTIIYTPKLCKITDDAPIVGSLINNHLYWVTFYNVDGDALTTNKFVAKRAHSVISDGIDRDKLLERIEIETAKDFVYVGESWRELYCRVYAYYADQSRKDVTGTNGLILEKPDLSTVGQKIIKAVYYNMDDQRFAETTKQIIVKEDDDIFLEFFKVFPQILISNKGDKSIVLNIIGHYSDGDERDITHRSVVSNFNENLFNEEQVIDITTDIGMSHYTEDYVLNVAFNETPYTVFFGDRLLHPEEDLNNIDAITNKDIVTYKVRDAVDLNNYHCPLTEIGTKADFSSPRSSLRTGKNLIIEYYNAEEELLHSVYATAEYRPESYVPSPRPERI